MWPIGTIMYFPNNIYDVFSLFMQNLLKIEKFNTTKIPFWGSYSSTYYYPVQKMEWHYLLPGESAWQYK